MIVAQAGEFATAPVRPLSNSARLKSASDNEKSPQRLKFHSASRIEFDNGIKNGTHLSISGAYHILKVHRTAYLVLLCTSQRMGRTFLSRVRTIF